MVFGGSSKWPWLSFKMRCDQGPNFSGTPDKSGCHRPVQTFGADPCQQALPTGQDWQFISLQGVVESDERESRLQRRTPLRMPLSRVPLTSVRLYQHMAVLNLAQTMQL